MYKDHLYIRAGTSVSAYITEDSALVLSYVKLEVKTGLTSSPRKTAALAVHREVRYNHGTHLLHQRRCAWRQVVKPADDAPGPGRLAQGIEQSVIGRLDGSRVYLGYFTGDNLTSEEPHPVVAST